ERVILDTLDAHRLKRSIPHVQRDLGQRDATILQHPENLRGEMQARRRRGDGSAVPREHRLIPFAIVYAIVALDVRRQRNMADRVDDILNRSTVAAPQPDRAPSVKVPLEDLAVKRAVTELDACAR